MVIHLTELRDAQAAEIIALKTRIKKLEKRCKPSISHHRAWLKSVQRLSMKKRFGKKESVSKQGRKKDKPTLDNSTLDDLNADHGMKTEEPMNQGRLSEENEELISTARPGDSTVRPDIGTTDQIVPPPTTRRIFNDEDITMAETLIKMKEEKAKEKEVSIKDIQDTSRPARSILTLKPLLTIDPKDKGKDAEVARLVYEEELAELEREKEKRQREEEASKASIAEMKRPGRRLKMKAIKKSKRQKIDSDLKEEEHLKTFLQIVPDEEGEVDYEVLDKRFPIINLKSKFYHLDRHGVECIYYRIFRSDGSSRWIKTFSEMVTRFDRMDLEELYNLVMQRFETTTPEGDLRTMFEETSDDDLWKNQEKWILKSWNFYKNCEFYTLTLEDGTEIYMLAARRYPLTKETLGKMLALRLIAACESKAVFYLLRFIQKQIHESGSHDRSEKDLALCYCNEALAIPEQTATGKETSNPFMAETRFGRNEATKKTQKTLLKEMYKNFSATTTDLPSEWNTHVMVWSNKSNLDTMSIDDLYNNFKIVKQEVKGTACSNLSSQNSAFMSSPSPSSTNEVPTAYGVSTASTQSSTASIKVSTANLSDATVQSRNQDSSRRTVNIEDTPPKAMVSIDEVGFNWSYMDEDEASKSLDKLIGSQITDKSRKGVGFESYNAVPPPPTGLFSPPKIDLSYSGPEEFQQPEFESYEPKYYDKLERKTVVSTDAKIEFVKAKQQEKPVRIPVKYAEMYRPRPVNIVRPRPVNTARPNSSVVNAVRKNKGHPQQVQEDQGYVDSGCSRHMTGNMSYLSNFKRYVTFRGGANGGRITGKGTIYTANLDFEDVYY
nr:hypothetical protein [Tanacetum cinerariifolium]